MKLIKMRLIGEILQNMTLWCLLPQGRIRKSLTQYFAEYNIIVRKRCLTLLKKKIRCLFLPKKIKKYWPFSTTWSQFSNLYVTYKYQQFIYLYYYSTNQNRQKPMGKQKVAKMVYWMWRQFKLFYYIFAYPTFPRSR